MAPSVADEPTAQYTFLASAPLVSTIELDVAVVSVEPAMKTYVPAPLRVSLPVIAIDDGDAYAPAASVMPPRSSASVSATADGASAPSETSVAVSSACAAAAAALLTSSVPVKLPGGKPLTAVPGFSAIEPATDVAPTFVTVVAATTLMPQRADGAGGAAPKRQPAKPASTTVLSIIVTAPVDAYKRPTTVAPVFALIDACA